MPPPPEKDPFDFQRDDTNRISDIQAIRQQHRAFQSLDADPAVIRRKVGGLTHGYQFPLLDESGEFNGSFAEIHSHPTKEKDEDGTNKRVPGALLTINRHGQTTHFTEPGTKKPITTAVEERAVSVFRMQKRAAHESQQAEEAQHTQSMPAPHPAVHEPVLSTMAPHSPHGQAGSSHELSPHVTHHPSTTGPK